MAKIQTHEQVPEQPGERPREDMPGNTGALLDRLAESIDDDPGGESPTPSPADSPPSVDTGGETRIPYAEHQRRVAVESASSVSDRGAAGSTGGEGKRGVAGEESSEQRSKAGGEGKQQTLLERIKGMPHGAVLAIAGVTAAAWFFSQPKEDDSWLTSSLRTLVRYSGLGVLGAWAWQKFGGELMAAEQRGPADAKKAAKKPGASPYESAPEKPAGDGPTAPAPAERKAPAPEVQASEPKLQSTPEGLYLWTDPEHSYKVEVFGLDGKEEAAKLIGFAEEGDMYRVTARKAFDIPGAEGKASEQKEFDLSAAVPRSELARIAENLRKGGDSATVPVELEIDTQRLPDIEIVTGESDPPVKLREHAQSWLDGTLVSFWPGYRKVNDTTFRLQYGLFFRKAE